MMARGRDVIGPRQLMASDRWRGKVRWSERMEARRRGHQPDLGARLPDTGEFYPVEVELSQKSAARLTSVLRLHRELIDRGESPAVLYVCRTDHLAELVRAAAARAGLANDRFGIEMLDTVHRYVLDHAEPRLIEGWYLLRDPSDDQELEGADRRCFSRQG